MPIDVLLGLFVAGYWTLICCVCLCAVQYEKLKERAANNDKFVEMV